MKTRVDFQVIKDIDPESFTCGDYLWFVLVDGNIVDQGSAMWHWLAFRRAKKHAYRYKINLSKLPKPPTDVTYEIKPSDYNMFKWKVLKAGKVADSGTCATMEAAIRRANDSKELVEEYYE